MMNDEYIRTSEAVKFIGLIGSLALALSGQANLLREPYDKIMTIVGISATTIFSFLMHPPRNSTSLERRTDYMDDIPLIKRDKILENIPNVSSDRVSKLDIK